MYLVYILIGTLHLLTGIITSTYFVWFVKKYNLDSNGVVSIFQATSTILIGMVYIFLTTSLEVNEATVRKQYSKVVMDDKQTLEDMTDMLFFLNDTSEVDEYLGKLGLVKTEESDVGRINVSYNTYENTTLNKDKNGTHQHHMRYYFQLIKQRLSRNDKELRTHNFKRAKSESKLQTNTMESDSSESEFDCKVILYKYILFIFSFLHSTMFLMQLAINVKFYKAPVLDKKENCNSAVSGKVKNDKRDNSEHVREQTFMAQLKSFKIIILTLCISYVIIICSTSLLVVVIQEGNNNQTNVSNSLQILKLSNINNRKHNLNDTEIDNIVKNVYDVIKRVNSSEKAHENVKILEYKLRFTNCDYNTVVFRSYIFLFLVVSYILAIFYAETIERQHLGHIFDFKVKSLKISEIGFVLFWLPAVLELLAKEFIMRSTPSIFCDTVLLIGNLNQILINVVNVITSKKLMNNLIAPKV